MVRTESFKMISMTLLAAGVMLLGGVRISLAQPAAADNGTVPKESVVPAANAPAAESAKPKVAIEVFVDFSEDSFAEEATLKELTSLLRDAIKAELEGKDFKVTMLDAPAPGAANAPYLLKVRLTDYRTIGVQRAIYARYELIGGGKIVKQKLTQSTVKSAFQLPKVLGMQIANIVRDRILGAPDKGQGKKP